MIEKMLIQIIITVWILGISAIITYSIPRRTNEQKEIIY